MDQNEIELILSRHWASYLETPIFLVDPEGNLLYYNEPAEPILGHRFAETGTMNAAEWSSIYKMADEQHQSLGPEELPLYIALTEHQLARRRLWLTGLDNVKRLVEAVCFPLIGQADRFLGAIALFWEVEQE